MSREKPIQPFDEKAALAELERLRESIQAARQARQRTSDEFEAFIKSFRTPAPIAERPTTTARALEPSQPAAPESIAGLLHSPDPLPSTVAVPPPDPLPLTVAVPPPDPLPSTVALPSTTISLDDSAALASLRPTRRYRISPRLLGMLGIIAVIAVGVVSLRPRREIPPAKTVNAVSDSATPTRNAAVAPAAASQTAAASPAAHGVAIELRVIRPVWMRVVVDGRKDVEGTVPASEPLHFTADQSIVVRVGNGGDVVVKTGTREEPFGDTGQPRTRTFSKP